MPLKCGCENQSRWDASCGVPKFVVIGSSIDRVDARTVFAASGLCSVRSINNATTINVPSVADQRGGSLDVQVR